MAQVGGVVFSTRRECLEGFAATLGVYPPRQPIPEWWESFEKWYQEARAETRLRADDDPNMTNVMVRLEAFGYDEEEGEEEEEKEEEYDDSGLDDDFGLDEIDVGGHLSTESKPADVVPHADVVPYVYKSHRHTDALHDLQVRYGWSDAEMLHKVYAALVALGPSDMAFMLESTIRKLQEG